jgi:hypothetical protein
MVNRFDLSLTQDVFRSISGKKHTGQIRLDITNFGNLLNHNWGVGKFRRTAQILTNPSMDANGALTYRLALVNSNYIASTWNRAPTCHVERRRVRDDAQLRTVQLIGARRARRNATRCSPGRNCFFAPAAANVLVRPRLD